MNFIKKWLPLVVVLATVFNLIAAYGEGNSAAIFANITALCGWIALASDELIPARKQSV